MSTGTLIVDASNMAYRARYSYSLSHQGKDTSVTYGVLRMLMALIKEHKPTGIIMCFDGGSPGYRKRLVPSYKSNRKHDDDPTFYEYIRQVQELQRMLPYFGILCVKREGIEADDLMFHASRLLPSSTIVTNDDDLLQAVNDNTAVLKPGKKENTLISEQNFKEIAGVPLDCFLLAKAILGDSSDNVPGVKGIGPKTIEKLFSSGQYDDSFLNDSMRLALTDFLNTGFHTAIYCMDLKLDLCGARQALISAIWQPYNNKMVYKYCFDNAFASLIEAGSLGNTFGPLTKPEFETADWRFPVIWDYERKPAGG